MHPGTADLIAPLIVFIAGLVVIRMILEHLLRRKLLAANLSEDMTRAYLQWMTTALHEDALKWGLVWVAVGIALVLIELLPYTLQDSISFGLIFIFGGGALLVYRALATRK